MPSGVAGLHGVPGPCRGCSPLPGPPPTRGSSSDVRGRLAELIRLTVSVSVSSSPLTSRLRFSRRCWPSEVLSSASVRLSVSLSSPQLNNHLEGLRGKRAAPPAEQSCTSPTLTCWLEVWLPGRQLPPAAADSAAVQSALFKRLCEAAADGGLLLPSQTNIFSFAC